MNKARQKEELYGLIGLYGFFILGLAAIDVWYSAWSQMHWGMIVLAIVAHVGVICSSLILFIEWEDPKFDVARKFFFAFWLGSVAFVAGFRVAKNEFNMFQDDVEKSKQTSFIQKRLYGVYLETPDEAFNRAVIQLECCAVMYLIEYHGKECHRSVNFHSVLL